MEVIKVTGRIGSGKTWALEAIRTQAIADGRRVFHLHGMMTAGDAIGFAKENGPPETLIIDTLQFNQAFDLFTLMDHPLFRRTRAFIAVLDRGDHQVGR